MSPAATGGGSEPPPIPKDAPGAPRRGLSKKAIVLIVAGGLAIPCVAGVVTSVAVMLPKMQEKARRTTCMSHLSELANGWVVRNFEDAKEAQRWSGSSLWLSMRRGVPHGGDGPDKLLLCPGDAAAMPLDGTAAWSSLDLEHPPRDLCSYAGRDFANFPVDPDSTEKQAIGACVHHRGGAVVTFAEGDTQFMTRDDLGISEDDEIRCGPDSASPILRRLVGGN